MPQLQVLPHAALEPNVGAQILALCSDAYEEDFSPYLALLSQATHLLAWESEELVSHAAWVARELRVGPQRSSLSCAYIEAVATPKRYQGRGFGSRVMRAIPPLLGQFDVAALSPSYSAFYQRLGWELWKGPLSYLQNGQIIACPGEEAMIYRLAKTPTDLSLLDPLETDWRPGEVW